MDRDFNIADTLVAAGFPYIEVLPSNRSLAYKCVKTYKVVTKCIPVLDDFRKGLDLVHVMASTISKTEVSELRQLIKNNQTDDSTTKAEVPFEKY